MKFNINNSIEVLEKTPAVLNSLLSNLSKDWLKNNEGKDTWSPYDIIDHLIFGEKTDWTVRIKIILNDSKNKKFEPYDRFAQFNNDQTIGIIELLNEFSILRANNIMLLKTITPIDLTKTGIHPAFGEITLEQLISTWVVHDLGHIAQITRVMAKQYKEEVGPFAEYLSILK